MTIKSEVLLIAPELSSINDDLFDLVIADATRQVSTASVGRNVAEARRYLTAHILTLLTAPGASSGASGSIDSKTAGDVSVSYSNAKSSISGQITRYDLTIYGQRYIQLLRRKIVPAAVY